MFLGGVVEMAVDVARRSPPRRPPGNAPGVAGFPAGAPQSDAFAPAIEHRVAVAADVKLVCAVQADIDEIGGDVLVFRPLSGGIGDDKRDAMLAQQLGESGDYEALVPDLERMSQRAVGTESDLRPAFDLAVVS